MSTWLLTAASSLDACPHLPSALPVPLQSLEEAALAPWLAASRGHGCAGCALSLHGMWDQLSTAGHSQEFQHMGLGWLLQLL